MFLITSFFTTSLSLLQSAGTGTNLSTSNLSTLLFKLLKLVGTFFNLSMPNLSTSDFKLAKSVFLAKSDVSTLVAFFKSVFLASKKLGFGKYSLIYTISFLPIQLLIELSHPFHFTYNLSPFLSIAFSIANFFICFYQFTSKTFQKFLFH